MMEHGDRKRAHAIETGVNVHPSSSGASPDGTLQEHDLKRRAVAQDSVEPDFLARLPNAQMYERSYMHRNVVDHVVVTKTGFVLTLSADGHVKFWKRRNEGIEFVKDFRAHIGPITATAVSPDGQMFATTSTDKNVKIFDVVNFDMIGIIAVDCLPAVLCWVIDPLDQTICIAVSGMESPVVYTYDPYADTKPKRTIDSPHRQPLQLMAYNRAMQCIVSIDKGGMVEYWSLDKPGELPPTADFKLKSRTDLYEFKKSKCVPNSITFSHDFSLFVCTCSGDSIVRVFQASNGKLFRKYDESISASNAIQASDEGKKFKLDDMEFGRRLVVESELLKSSAGQKINAVFDESGKFLLLASLFGIKIVSLIANKVVRVLGKTEPYRFVNIALVQGSFNDEMARLDMSAPSSSGANAASDPIIFCTAFKRNRFYMFTRNEPDYTTQDGDRDVFNEKPTREEVSLAMAPVKKQVAKSAVLRTTLGDIRLALFPEHAPKAVENFVVHSRSGFYNGVIFHRVIKHFMIQTGDPLGDGTGGESIWGRSFEDEFTPSLRHNCPYTLSMANSGPGTNGSQFFITTVESAPWLDDKHTIFGRVLAGADVVRLIESVETDKHDKPLEDVSILNIQVNHNE